MPPKTLDLAIQTETINLFLRVAKMVGRDPRWQRLTTSFAVMMAGRSGDSSCPLAEA